MACYNFSFEEIREQLAVLGYTDVSDAKVAEFKRDLDGISMIKANGRGGSGHARFAQLEEEDDEEEEEEETYVSSTITPTAEIHSGRRVRICTPRGSEVTPRRTVLRKVVRRDGETNQRHVEETSYTEEVSALDSNESLNESSWSPPPRGFRHAPPINGHEFMTRTRRPLSARSSSSIQTETSSVSAPCGGLIMRQPGQPHTRNIKKGDPVSRYHAYKQLWEMQRPPGDLNHRQLRWTVKEAMMVHEVPMKRPPKQKSVRNF